jgi:hypothetical protein
MKKLAAILLLGIFVFNLFGYRLWVSYMENAADISLEKAFDKNNYNEEELITLKKAVNLPYYNNTKEFSRADGEVEVDGVYYKYVKYRIYNGYMEMLCLPNTQKTKIRKAKDNFYKIVADIQKNTSGKSKSNSGNTLKKMLGEFEEYTALKAAAPSTIISTTYSFSYNSSLGVLHKASVEQPPDSFNS